MENQEVKSKRDNKAKKPTESPSTRFPRVLEDIRDYGREYSNKKALKKAIKTLDIVWNALSLEQRDKVIIQIEETIKAIREKSSKEKT